MNVPVYDADTHAYTTPAGKPLISVTQVLVKVGIIDARWFDEDSAWRGSVIHAVCELDDKGTLKESSIDPLAMPYLDGWRECKLKLGLKIKPEMVEKPKYHPILLYAGMPDLACTDADFDRKTGAAARWHALQLSGYNNLSPNPRTRRRYTVRLPGNGKYVIKEYPPSEASRDFAVFQSALNVCQWRENGN